jgi:beta-N-acetylhexosaminidase
MSIIRKTLLCFLILTFNLAANAQRDSLDIKIGQMLLIGFPGTTVDAKVLEEVRSGKVGSIIIFEKNIPPANSFIALKKIIWTYQQAATIPLFIGIDQEGGRVNRLKTKYGFPNSITAAAMAKGGKLDSVRLYADAMAATLSGLGININFAPVIDLATNPNNPIIAKYGRAFSAREDTVTRYAKEFIKMHHKYGVLTSLKHFPGHGSSKDDTHLGIADVTNTWNAKELEPYRALIDSGYADAVMTSHIVNKTLDKNGNPGTLSVEILDGILRKRLGFNGVVFSDDMQMHAITKHYGLEEAIKLAILAGVDIMTFSNNISGSEVRTVDKVHQIVKGLVVNGQIPAARIDQSYRRIIKLKRQLVVPDDDLHRNELLAIKAEAKAREEKLQAENTALAQQVKELQAKQAAAEATPTDTKKKKKKKK